MTTYPDKTYQDEGWKGWEDFLGNENISTHNFKKLPFEEVLPVTNSVSPATSLFPPTII